MIWYIVGLTTTHLIAAVLGAAVLARILMHYGDSAMKRDEARTRRKVIDAELKLMERTQGNGDKSSIPDGMGVNGKPYKDGG